jgi:molecular chaperone Hsp33
MEIAGDQLVRTLTSDGSVSVRVLAATHLVREAVRRHQTSPTASVALGRALMGGLLLATEGKDGERVQLLLRGNGPLGSITVTAHSAGTV